MSVDQLDLVLRGATLGSLALSVAILLRDARHQATGLLAIAVAASVAGYVLVLRPALGLPAVILWPFLVLSHGTAMVFWLFVRALFEDEFRPGWPHLGAWIVWVAAWIGARRLAYDGTTLWEELPQEVVRLAGIALVGTRCGWRAPAALTISWKAGDACDGPSSGSWEPTLSRSCCWRCCSSTLAFRRRSCGGFGLSTSPACWRSPSRSVGLSSHRPIAACSGSSRRHSARRCRRATCRAGGRD
jgi:hypothetical protein